jgi:hypothetical protein
VCIASVHDKKGKSIWSYISSLDLLVNPENSDPIGILGIASGSAVIVTTIASHDLVTGNYVRISGVTGHTLANGVFRISVVNSTTITLEDVDGSTGGSYISGGTVTKLEWISAFDKTTATDNLSVLPLPANESDSEGTMAVIRANEHEGRTGWCGIRMTTSGAQPPTEETTSILAVMNSGQLDGRSLFAASYYYTSGRSEGVAKACVRADGPRLNQFGGVDKARHYRWNPGSDFRTAWKITASDMPHLPGSPNYFLIYRSDPYLTNEGETLFTPFYFADWEVLDGSEGGTKTDLVNSTDIDTTRTAKDAGHMPIPKGSLFAMANDRLFVAGTETKSQLWVSADRDPFSFRQTPTIDDDGNQDPLSATYRTFGGESITALLPMQGDLYGVDTLLLWTDRGMYRLGGFDSRTITQASRLSEKGTRRPQTVAPYDGTVWYLDTEGQARRSNGGLASQATTRAKVDDLLAKGNLSGACAVSGFGAYRLFFREEGQTGQHLCLVWQEETDEWVLDRYPFSIAGVITHETENGRVLLACEEDGTLWELERKGQTTDDGTPIPIRIDGPEISQGNFEPLTFGQMGIVCDGAVDTTLQTLRTCPYDGSVTEGRFDLTNANLTTPSAWRYDATEEGGIPGTPVNPSCIPSVRGNMPGGKRIRTLNIEVTPRGTGADRV